MSVPPLSRPEPEELMISVDDRAVVFPLRGSLVSVAPPLPSEYDAITLLRNRGSVGRWFFDSRKLEVEANRQWLAALGRQRESQVLVIRSVHGGFLGFVGWSKFGGVGQAIHFGRFALELCECRRYARSLGFVPRIADEVGLLLLDFAFETLRVATVHAEVMEANRASIQLCKRLGLKVSGDTTHCDDAGGTVRVILLRLTREEWTMRHSSGGQAKPNPLSKGSSSLPVEK